MTFNPLLTPWCPENAAGAGLGTGPSYLLVTAPALHFSASLSHIRHQERQKESSRLETLNSLAQCVLTVYSLQVRHNDVGPTHSFVLRL